MKTTFALTSDLNINHLKNGVITSKDIYNRPSMQGVFFTGNNLVITNGHIMVKYPVDIMSNETGASGIIPLQAFDIKTLDKIANRGKVVVPYEYTVDTELKTVTVSFLGKDVISFPLIDEKYPAWETVWPKEFSDIPFIGLDLNTVQSLIDCIPKLQRIGVKFRFSKKNGAIVFNTTINDCGMIEGLLMPCMIKE